MNTFWVTFYSYKGGVGRSMALANVAADLAANGRRVVIVDFDLEAPGLDAFEEFGLPPGAPGVVEYVSEYLRTDRVPEVAPFVRRAEPTKRLSGNLWVMSAGRKDQEYNRLRVGINWADLYENRQGASFFENFKADIERTFRPDYVFVDSRTGLTDVGGVCTLHLPDLVVLMFSLNEQNLQGIASVARVLKEAENAPLLLPVASPVPNASQAGDGLLQERYKRAKSLLGVEVAISISYSSVVSLKEQIFTWGKPSRLVMEYQALRKAITDANPRGLDYLIRAAESAAGNLEVDRAEEMIAALEQEYPDRADAWIQIADWKRTGRDLTGMEAALRRALEIDSSNMTVFGRLEGILRAQNRDKDFEALAVGVLADPSGLDQETRESVQFKLGECLMRQGNPAQAAIIYESILKDQTARKKKDQTELKKLGDDPGDLALIFNLAEARRRSGAEVPESIWATVINIFGASAAGSNPADLALRLNQLQAMHIAGAMVGDIEEAKECLNLVERVTVHVSPHERLFCVAIYDYVEREEFLEWNGKMLAALEKGELWDGMKIPAKTEGKPEQGEQSEGD